MATPKTGRRFARWLSVDFGNLVMSKPTPSSRAQHIKLMTTESSHFLLSESQPWKTVQRSLYAALFKMSGSPRHRPGRRPALFEMISAKWVYGPVLPPEVYAEVKSRLATGDKIHQHLKPDALTLVERQIIAVTSIANGCSDYRDFEARCMAAFPVKGR